MNAAPLLKPLTMSNIRIVRTIADFRYMCAADVAQLLFSPSSLTYVREALAMLAGARDCADWYYMYRLPLPSTTRDNRTKVYTLGSRGRQFLQTEWGITCDWYARPGKLRTLSHSSLLHNLLLTRLVVLAHLFCRRSTGYSLSEVRLSYELSRHPELLSHRRDGRSEQTFAVPDAWVDFVRGDGLHFPVLLELYRGMEYRERFKLHANGLIDLITSVLYEQIFSQQAVKIAYVTTSESRRSRMCAWTAEVLRETGLQSWASVFHFAALAPEKIYESPDLFTRELWHQPGAPSPVALLPPP